MQPKRVAGMEYPFIDNQLATHASLFTCGTGAEVHLLCLPHEFALLITSIYNMLPVSKLPKQAIGKTGI